MASVGGVGRIALALVGAAAAACSAASRPEGAGGAWSFEAGLESPVFVRFRGRTYAEEPQVEWAAGAAAAESNAGDLPSSGAGRGPAAPRAGVVEDRVAGRAPELGRRALELQIPDGARVLVHTPVAPLGGSAVLGGWLRAVDAGPPARATLRLFRSLPTGGAAYGAKQEELAAREVEVGAAWSRAQVTARVEGDVYGQIEIAGPRVVRLDGLSLLAEGAHPLKTEGRPIDATLTVEEARPAGSGGGTATASPPVRGVVTTNAAALLHLELSRPLAGDERLRLQLRDAAGVAHPLAVPPPALYPPARSAHPPAETHPIHVELPLPATAAAGPFLVEAELLRGGQRLLRAVRPFVVLPPMPPAAASAVESAPLGTHTRLDARHLAIAARLGLRWLRLHDASMIGQWITVEPVPGARRFHDEAVDLALARGLRLLGVLEATPRWASSAPATDDWYAARRWPPRDGAAFSSYVRAVASHYRGRIDHWEVWNEPYLDEFFRGSPADYAALLERALVAGHAAAPSVTLLASAAPEGPRAAWTRAALANLGTAATPGRTPRAGRAFAIADGFAFHPYDDRLVHPPARLTSSLATLRELLPGAREAAPRLWATEGAVLGAAAATLDPEAPQPSPFPVETAAAAQVAWAVDLLGGGTERLFVYQLVESPFRNDADLSLLESDGTPRPAAAALAVLSLRLGPRRFVDRARRRDGIELARFGGGPPGTEELAVLHRSDGAPLDRSALPDGALDVWGNRLSPGAAPHLAYVQASAEVLRSLAR